MKVILKEDYLKIPEGGKFNDLRFNHFFTLYSQNRNQGQKGYN